MSSRRNKFVCYLFLLIFLFSSCIAIPGYVDNNGNITAPYSSEITIEIIAGAVTIISSETSKGVQNINPAKSDPLKTKKNDTVYLPENNTYSYHLEGNHSIVFAFRTLNDEATFKITYKNAIQEYTIHKSDISDKFVYLENY